MVALQTVEGATALSTAPDVVYVVRPGPVNEELRYSLRSLQNLPHGQVWVIGYKPPWVTNVGYLPTIQRGSKYRNSTQNIHTAAVHDDISESFVYMNDDFFIMHPLPYLVPKHRGPVDQVAEQYAKKFGRSPNGPWRQGMLLTRNLLQRWGFPNPLSYELHIPMVMEKQKVVDALRRAGTDSSRIAALHKRTLYGNLYEVGGEYMTDCKVGKHGETWSGEWPFLSTTERTFQGAVGRFIRSQFTEPSSYELI